MRGGRQDIGVDREKRRRKRKCGAKKSGGRKSAAARDTAPPCLLGDANAHTVLFDPGERLDGVAPALGRDAVGSDAGLFQCRESFRLMACEPVAASA